MKTKYQKQAQEIAELAKSIINKSNKFAKDTKNPYFGDLAHVIEVLKEANNFLK